MDENKYKKMESILNKINQKCIQLSSEETRIYQTIMKSVTSDLITELKKDALFKALYERMFFGGSYYDNLKVGKAEEYDLDLVLNLPHVINPKVDISNKHGFVHCQILEFGKMLTRAEKEPYLTIPKLFLDDNNYLSTVKIFSWITSIINKVLNELPREGTRTIFEVKIDDEVIKVYGKQSAKAPAFTFNVSGHYKDKKISLDVDLVPCFQFHEKHTWPAPPYKPNPSTLRTSFLIVPKKPYNINCNSVERYWRLSFQEQEREIIGKDYKALKSSLKLLKKLRDHQNHCKVASYFIKTIFLLEVEEHPEEAYWSRPLSIVFMTMLKKYQKAMEDGIPYFWNRKFNLIEHLNPATKSGLSNFLKKMISDIDRNICEDPFVVAKYLISTSDLEMLKGEVDLEKKVKKAMENNTTALEQTMQCNGSGNSSPPRVTQVVLNGEAGGNENKLDVTIKQILSCLGKIQTDQAKILKRIESIDERLSVVEAKINKEHISTVPIDSMFDRLHITASQPSQIIDLLN